MDRPEKPPQDLMNIWMPAVPLDMSPRTYVATVRRHMERWTAFVAGRMTDKEIRVWLDAREWGAILPDGSNTHNPYLHGQNKTDHARIVAQMILVDGHDEPDQLA